MNSPQTSNCCTTDCVLPGTGLYGGKTYCKKHCMEIFLGELALEYDAWAIDALPSERFRYLLGRVYAEYGGTIGGSYLSPARIRDRGFSFMKIPRGGSFCITRHLHAWSESRSRPMQRVVECWRFNIDTRDFSLEETRDWVKGDPD